MDNLFLNTMLDFELIKNEEVIKDINVSNKNESTDNLILTNKRLIKIKKEKHKTQLNAVSIENIQGIELSSVLPNSKFMIWSITAFITGCLLYIAFRETLVGILFFLFLFSLGIYLIIDHLASKKYQKLIFKTISNNTNIEYIIDKDETEFNSKSYIKLFFMLRWKLLHENSRSINNHKPKQIFPRYR